MGSLSIIKLSRSGDVHAAYCVTGDGGKFHPAPLPAARENGTYLRPRFHALIVSLNGIDHECHYHQQYHNKDLDQKSYLQHEKKINFFLIRDNGILYVQIIEDAENHGKHQEKSKNTLYPQ